MSSTTKSRVSLILPASLKAAAEKYAARDGVSVNQFISMALAEKVGAQGTAEFFEARGRHGDAASAARFLETAPDIEPLEEDRT